MKTAEECLQSFDIDFSWMTSSSFKNLVIGAMEMYSTEHDNEIKQAVDEFENELSLCLKIDEDEDGDKCVECDDTRRLLTELKQKIFK